MNVHTETPSLGAAVSRRLDAWADAIITGELGLHELPPAVAAFFHLGAAGERARLEQRIAELETECDRLYLAAAHPAERATELQRRLDQHFQNEAEQFFAPIPVAIAA